MRSKILTTVILIPDERLTPFLDKIIKRLAVPSEFFGDMQSKRVKISGVCDNELSSNC